MSVLYQNLRPLDVEREQNDYYATNPKAMIKLLEHETLTREQIEYLVEHKHLPEVKEIELLLAIINKFNGGPVGVETIATAIGEEVSTIEDVVEPFLLQEGFIKRTRSGRIARELSYNHLEINQLYFDLFSLF